MSKRNAVEVFFHCWFVLANASTNVNKYNLILKCYQTNLSNCLEDERLESNRNPFIIVVHFVSSL